MAEKTKSSALENQRIIPNIWCHGNAEEVGAAIAEVFVTAGIDADSEVIDRYPDHDLPDFQMPMAGKALVVRVHIRGYRLDLINAGNEFEPGMAISLMINFDPLLLGGDPALTQSALDRVWAGLSAAGNVRTPLQRYSFSAKYGWVEDRFGINWQLILTNLDGELRPFVLPSLLFSQESQGKAAEAGAFYREVFQESEAGQLVEYSTQTGPAAAGQVMFSDFSLLGQWFTAMDSGADGTEPFSPGFSLAVMCRGQAEIDYYWDRLSDRAEFEQCGWLIDKYGVSWQIVPENIDQLMARPNAYQNMMVMKKLIIDDF